MASARTAIGASSLASRMPCRVATLHSATPLTAGGVLIVSASCKGLAMRTPASVAIDSFTVHQPPILKDYLHPRETPIRSLECLNAGVHWANWMLSIRRLDVGDAGTEENPQTASRSPGAPTQTSTLRAPLVSPVSPRSNCS